MTFKIRTLFIALLLAMIAPSAFATDLIPLVPAKKNDGIIRILAIGNSFSEDAIEQYFYELAAADGQKIIVGNLYYPGCSLERHANNVKNNIPDYKYRKIVDGVKTETPETTIATAPGRLEDSEWQRIIKASDILSKRPLYIEDSAEINILQLRSKARQLKRQKGIKLIIIDYLQLLASERKRDNKVQEVSDISRQLKILAKELNIPVIALAQLSRSVEARQDKRPMLSDLRESGSIEQDADIVMFLYRDEYYNANTNNKNLAELIISKHRNGSTGKVL